MPVKLTFFVFLLFSFTSTVLSRPILHQSFFPNRYYSSPPSLPPAPTPIPAPSPPSPVQGLPFTPSTSSPSGFFPFSHPSSPPPSSPAATTTTAPFVSYPANISSLNVPHSSSPSRKLLSPKLLSLSLVSLFLAVLLLSVSLVLFLKRRRLNTAKSHTRLDTATDSTRTGPPSRPMNDPDRVKNETSSEFLYMGTLVNPATHHQGHLGNNISNGRGRNVKLDSPELRPLPPLANRNQAHAHFADVASSSSTETTSSLPDSDDSSSESLSPKGSASPDVGLTPKREYPTSLELVEMEIPESHLVSKQSYLTTEWISDSNSTLSSSCTSERNSDKEPVKGNNAVPFVPPPPPPPPLSKKAKAVGGSSKPPAFITPSRPFILKNATGASVLDKSFGSNDDNLEKKSEEEETMKPRLKPLHWDKVRASSGREMVWDHMKSSSFELNEEMIETLFVVNNSKISQKDTVRRAVLTSKKQENRVLDSKKSQNISILLRALNVSKEDVCGALLEGNLHRLGTELLENLLKMAPTKEEAKQLKEYKDAPPFELDPAERFLKAMLDIPSAFERIEAMLYVANFDSEVEYIMKSFETLEAACEELRKSRMFLKLLEAVLKTGNRMNVGTNRGGAQAFKLDTLLKLVDVKGADGKTTLLHFVVQEIIKAEGARMSTGDSKPDMNVEVKYRKLGLQLVAGLSSDLTNVKKAACMDSDVLSSEVSKLCGGIELVEEILGLNESTTYNESSQKFSESMNTFMKKSEEVIRKIQVQESVSLSAVKKLTAYFHGNSAKEEAHPFRIFMVVRDFLTILDRVCKEVAVINERTPVNSANRFPLPVSPTVSPTFRGRQQQYSSSLDDESSLP